MRANTELVDLEPVTGRRARSSSRRWSPSTWRAPAPRSPRDLLADWEASLAEFVRVIPREYAQALERRDEIGGPKTPEFRTLAA